MSTSPTAADELFRRQVHATMRVASRANIANAVSVVVLSLYVIPDQYGTFRAIWLSMALAAAALRATIWWLHTVDRPALEEMGVSRRYYRVTALEVCLQAVLTSTLVTSMLPRIDPDRQIVLSATLAGVMGAGAVALSPLRSIGITWVGIHVAGSVPVYLWMGTTPYYVLTLQMLLYGAVLMVCVVYLADSFDRRSVAELEALRERQLVELLLDDFEGGARDWLWEIGPEDHLDRASERLADVSGFSIDQLHRMTLVDLLTRVANVSEGGTDAVRDLQVALERGARVRDHVVPVVVAGREMWWALSAKPTTSPDGHREGWRGVGTDITEELMLSRELTRLAQTDPLTGLANRRQFRDRLESCLSGDGRSATTHLAIFDLDNFKAVNDTLGHDIGDELLVQVTRRLDHLTDDDFLARLGGDEFAVITQTDGAVEFPELLFARYLTAFSEPFTVQGNRITASASVGCAYTAPRDVDAGELVRMADLSLYDAKSVAPGRISPFTHSMSIRARHKASLLTDLDRAISADEFLFHYQPQHDLRTGKVVAMEALLRWEHPTRGLLPPSEFLQTAEESGLIVPIGERMLERACQQFSALRGGTRLAVNVAQVQLHDPGFLDCVERSLRAYAIEPRLLELEVTESAAISEQSTSMLRELHELGVRIAVDDFGTGYASLDSLQLLPVDLIKVDGKFVTALEEGDERSRRAALAIMKSVVDIAAALEIQTLAERVERESQLTRVRDLGFDLGQGFLMATPEPLVARHLTLVDPGP